MTTVMAGLRPSTSGVAFTARPALRTPSRTTNKPADVLRIKGTIGSITDPKFTTSG